MTKLCCTMLIVMSQATFSAEMSVPKSMTEAFFAAVERGDISGGYDRLFVGSTIPQDKPQAMTVLRQQTQNGLQIFGKILGHEFLNEKEIGSSIVRLVYILKSEKGPTVWEFYFYKPRDSWFLAKVTFNDQFGNLCD